MDVMCLYLWSLCLNPSHTLRAVNYCIFRYDFTGVDLTESSNDTTTGEYGVPSNIRWKLTLIFTLIKPLPTFHNYLQYTPLPNRERYKCLTFRLNYIVVPNFQCL